MKTKRLYLTWKKTS